MAPPRPARNRPLPAATQWFETEPAWLDPTGPREARGADPSWTVQCGTLVGGPFRWVLRHRADGHSRWTFLSVSGRPTPEEFSDRIAPFTGREVARSLVVAIRERLPEFVADR